jgi:ribosome-associated protein
MSSSITTTTPASAADTEAKTRQFAIDAARLAANTRCHNVVLLDVRGISPVTDYMIIASGTSPRQMRTVCDELAEWAQQQHGVRALNTDGLEGASWMLVDFVDAVVHVFNDQARQFYDLDGLWGDAKRVEFVPNPPASAVS